MPKVEKKIAYILYAGCSITAFIIAFMTLRYTFGTQDFLFMLSNAVLASLITILIPIAVVDSLNRRWITSIEKSGYSAFLGHSL